MRLMPTLALLALGLTLSGCNTTAPSPELLYEAPADPAAARIIGTQTQEPGLFASRHVAFVLMVDRRFVRDAEAAWARELTLTPGPHELQVEYRSSVFRSRAVFTLDAKAGASYRLQMTPGTDPDDDRRFCEFVIVDAATGQPVTPVKHTYATSSSDGNKSNFRPLD